MKKTLLLLLFPIYLINAQNQKLGTVLDSESKKPIEFVDIYNRNDNTITNENGKYFFLSSNDSISFRKLGYKEINTTFNQLADTLFLTAKPFELAEVVLSNEVSLFDQVRKSVPKNYPTESFNEKFFIRSMLRYNGEIFRIQDIQGKLTRRTLLYYNDMELKKKDYVFEVQNMRKIGVNEVTENETDIYFKFRSLRQILQETIQLSITRANYEIEEKYFDGRRKVRLEFIYNGGDEKVNVNGYYIINIADKAILEFYLVSKPNMDFIEKKDIKYRVTHLEKNVIFGKDLDSNRYVVKNGKITSIVEVKDKMDTFQTFFESEDILKSYGHFLDMKVKKNVNENKDVFKLDFPYNEGFWNAQNQLLLTDEMLLFIKNLGNSNEEFEIKSNLN